MGETLDILVVDDDVLNREGICLYLRRLGHDVYEAGDSHTAWTELVERRPNVVILDIVVSEAPWAETHYHQSEGIRLAKAIKRAYPETGIVLFSAHADRAGGVWDILQDGYGGIVYTVKGRPPEILLNGIRDAHAGRVVLDPAVLSTPHSLADAFVQRLSEAERPWVRRAASLVKELTSREREVLNRLAASYNVAGIADSLGISSKTVENHITAVYDKLGLKTLDKKDPALRKTVILAKASILYDLEQKR